MVMHHDTMFGSKRFRSSDVEESYFLRISAHNVTLTLKIGTQIVCTTPWVTTIHQDAKFHSKMLSDSKLYRPDKYSLEIIMKESYF